MCTCAYMRVQSTYVVLGFFPPLLGRVLIRHKEGEGRSLLTATNNSGQQMVRFCFKSQGLLHMRIKCSSDKHLPSKPALRVPASWGHDAHAHQAVTWQHEPVSSGPEMHTKRETFATMVMLKITRE